MILLIYIYIYICIKLDSIIEAVAMLLLVFQCSAKEENKH